MEELQAIQPSQVRWMYDCARLAYNLRRLEACDQWLDMLYEVRADYAPARELAAMLQAEEAGEQVAPLTGIARIVQESEQAMIDGELDTARAMLVQALEDETQPQNRDNPRLLVALTGCLLLALGGALSLLGRDRADLVVEGALPLGPFTVSGPSASDAWRAGNSEARAFEVLQQRLQSHPADHRAASDQS